MKIKQKIAAFAAAAMVALTSMSVTAFAADPIGTNPTDLAEGVQVSAQIPFDYDDCTWDYKQPQYNNGANYVDYRFTAPETGKMKITFDASMGRVAIDVYNDADKSVVATTCEAKTGGFKRDHWYWNGDAGICAGDVFADVTKGDYIIRVRRWRWWAENDSWDCDKGTGRLHLTVEMVKPEPPLNIKAQDITAKSAKLTWGEPEGCTAYEVRYKASGDKNWSTKSEIMDNKVTLTGLKASTTYTYQMRSYANKLVGEWGKTATFKTSGDAYTGKLGVPSVNSVTLKWKAVDHALTYNVRYKVGNGKWTTKTVSSNSITISVSAGKTYTYAIRAVNGKNKGAWSAYKTFTT